MKIMSCFVLVFISKKGCKSALILNKSPARHRVAVKNNTVMQNNVTPSRLFTLALEITDSYYRQKVHMHSLVLHREILTTRASQQMTECKNSPEIKFSKAFSQFHPSNVNTNNSCPEAYRSTSQLYRTIKSIIWSIYSLHPWGQHKHPA